MFSNKLLVTIFSICVFVLACLDDESETHNAAIEDNAQLTEQWYKSQYVQTERRHDKRYNHL